MKLDIKRVLAANGHKPYTGALQELLTPWGETLDVNAPLSEHPHPQAARTRWKSLNGSWDYAIVPADNARIQWKIAEEPEHFDGKIVVPFSPEALLSGVGRQLTPDELLWYKRAFTLPKRRKGDAVILHVEALDWAATLFINGKRVGRHTGAYLPFSFDITSFVHAGQNSISFCVFDPSEKGTQLRGKQRLTRGTMWYTAQSGIWQSVWLELVPQQHIEDFSIRTDADKGMLFVDARLSCNTGNLVVEVLYEGKTLAQVSAPVKDGQANVSIAVESPIVWSPENPALYDLRLSCGQDMLQSYCAFRTVSIEQDTTGIPRFCLNHTPLFLRGLLNQAYWSDGLLTAPSEEARIFDIEAAKAAGFNMFRLHIKLESDRWYYLCDKLGMLVWQDMPSGGDELSPWHTQQKPTLFSSSWGGYVDTTEGHRKALAAGDGAYRREWLETCKASIKRLSFHPSLVSWVLFNESWGQFDSAKAAAMVAELDPTRPILATSGWYDQGAGDYLGIHNYFRPLFVTKDVKRKVQGLPERAFVISEFGGLSWFVPEHSSCPSPYGYASFGTIDEWREALAKLLQEADALEERGLCGFVYTQVSDVEEETNGLLTYDRRVNKLLDSPKDD